MAKFITAKEAAELIPDGATVAVAGLGVSGWAWPLRPWAWRSPRWTRP